MNPVCVERMNAWISAATSWLTSVLALFGAQTVDMYASNAAVVDIPSLDGTFAPYGICSNTVLRFPLTTNDTFQQLGEMLIFKDYSDVLHITMTLFPSRA